MDRLLVPATVLSICLATLVALPAAATFEYIKQGTDYWRTPANSATQFTFPAGDVESLCKVPPSNAWDHKVNLRGIPAQGSDWDSAVSRLDKAKFDKSGNAHTRVQFKSLAMESVAPNDTPCGKLIWMARLAGKAPQPITKMKITKKSDKGGVFFAELALRVELQANDAGTGKYIGSLFYDFNLPEAAGGAGTPWSYGPTKGFRAGMTENNNCLDVLREKLGTQTDARHIYFISDLIAAGKCSREK